MHWQIARKEDIMSKVSQFGFTNNSDSDNTVTAKSLGVTSNYAVITDKADQAVLSNKTTPIDLQEKITYQSRDIQTVNNDLNIQYPSPVKRGIQYGVLLEETLSTTDTSDASFRMDEPIVMSLSIRHGKSGNINNEVVSQCFVRLLSTLMRADGTWRFDDLMRSAERPIVD
jgi:hypothetical protein